MHSNDYDNTSYSKRLFLRAMFFTGLAVVLFLIGYLSAGFFSGEL